MKRSCVLSLTVAILAGYALFTPRPAFADHDTYTVTDLGVLPGTTYSWVWQQSVNERGEVAVYSSNIADPFAFFTDLAYVWSNSTLYPLEGIPGGTSTIAYSLNNRGQVCGYTRQDGGFQHGVLWNRGVRIQLPELPGDTRGNTYTLNDAGVVTGFTRHPDPNLPFQLRHATLWYPDHGTYKVKRLPGLTSGLTGDGYDEALSINDRGEVCGDSGLTVDVTRPVLWRHGKVFDLGTLGGPSGYAFAINNATQIVGQVDKAPGVKVPFFWECGRMTELPIPAGEALGLALDINDKGEAVGFSMTNGVDYAKGHALLWKNGRMIDLQTKIPKNSPWTLLEPGGINERGQISGFGLLNGQYRAFLLTPKHHEGHEGHDGDDDHGHRDDD